jgi:pSer/pThr/pTyr-binding forkhead associated (FHA) protein
MIDSKTNQEVDGESSNIWGLLRRNGTDKEWKLIHRVKDNRRDVYSIGSSPECDIVIADSRVSSTHCLIFCDYSDDSLTICISDCSDNGTFLNDALIRVTNGERAELKSGDEIFLMNPRFINFENGLVSFMFVNMRDRLLARKKIVHTTGSTHKTPGVEFQRRIEDLYVIGDPIGSGMCGQVHICTHKSSRVQYAVKIIDTRKFSKTPGLSPTELRQEAELMRALHHVSASELNENLHAMNATVTAPTACAAHEHIYFVLTPSVLCCCAAQYYSHTG